MLRSSLSSPFRLKYSKVGVVVQQRYRAKRWPADAVQLFAKEYKHSNPVEHFNYQVKRYRYARRGLVAPRTNDYDSDPEDISEDFAKYIPELWKQSNFKEDFSNDVKEAYLDYRREQKMAQDDPRSPFYFADEEEAKKSAMENAVAAAIGRMERRVTEDEGNTIFQGKIKLESDPAPPNYTPPTSLLSSYIPEPDPVNYPEWKPYSPELPTGKFVGESNTTKGSPLGLPKWRESQIRPDGSAIAKGSRKDAVAIAVIRRGEGDIKVNGKELVDYFRVVDARDAVLAPLLVSESLRSFDVQVNVSGGGVKGNYNLIYLLLII